MSRTAQGVRRPGQRIVSVFSARGPGWWLAVSAGAAVAFGAGLVVGAGGHTALLLVLATVGLTGVLAVWWLVGDRIDGLIAIEAPLILLLISNQVFRLRSAADIATNPVDTAGTFRVACVGLAGLLGMLALMSRRSDAVREQLTTTPFRIYAGYVVVVFLAAPVSVDAPLTAYRGVELIVGMAVMAGAWNVAGLDAKRRVGAVLYWFVAALVGSVWLGVLYAPDQAIKHFKDLSIPIGFALDGVFPSISSNSVGALGVLLTLWSLARATSPHEDERLRPSTAYPLALLGFVTLIGAQYRTGYVAFVIGAMAFLLLRRKWLATGFLALVTVGLIIAVPSLIAKAEPYALRGATIEQARALDSRVVWWGHAIQVWETSPIIGRGLLTATRFEVFQPLGLDATSTIHSTWVEALVGTGIAGISLLVIALLVTFRRSIGLIVRDRWRIIPLLLLIVLLARSITGSTFESFQEESLVFMWIMLSLRPQEPEPSDPHGGLRSIDVGAAVR